MRIRSHRLLDGQTIRWGWGMAYFDHARAEAVCYPLPFNWVARWVRAAYWWLVWPKRNSKIDLLCDAARKEGQKIGDTYFEHEKQMAYERGVVDGREQMQAQLHENFWELAGRSPPD